MVDIKGAQGLWLLSEEVRERLKASEFKHTNFVQKQKMLVVEPGIGGTTWNIEGEATNDPVLTSIGSDDEDAKLFPDETKLAKLSQVTLKGSDSGLIKWVYEGAETERHGEQVAGPNLLVYHDCLKDGVLLRRGMMSALLIQFQDDKIGAPNPRSVTAGHVYVLDQPAMPACPKLVHMDEGPILLDNTDNSSAGDDEDAANLNDFDDSNIMAFTSDCVEDEYGSLAHLLKVGIYVIAKSPSASPFSGYIVDMRSGSAPDSKLITIAPDPLSCDGIDDVRKAIIDIKDFDIEPCFDMQPLFSRMEPTDIFNETGNFIQVDQETMVQLTENRDGTLPIVAAYCTSAMETAARGSLGGTMIVHLTSIQIGSDTIKVGDLIGSTGTADNIETIAIVTSIIIPFSFSGDLDPKQVARTVPLTRHCARTRRAPRARTHTHTHLSPHQPLCPPQTHAPFVCVLPVAD